MYVDEEEVPSDPRHNELLVDNIGIVWRYDKTDDDWIKTFYSFDKFERKTLVNIVLFYRDMLEKYPDDMIEEDYDKDELNKAIDYLIKKLGDDNESGQRE